MKFLFNYIEEELSDSRVKALTFDLWSHSPIDKYYDEINKIYSPESPVMEYNGNTYLITEQDAIAGRGGMDEGSPHTFIVTKLNRVNFIDKVVEEEDRPRPVENPDFSVLISQLENTMDRIVNGDYHEDNDDDHYCWEEAMTAVYGEDVWDWWRKNTR